MSFMTLRESKQAHFERAHRSATNEIQRETRLISELSARSDEGAQKEIEEARIRLDAAHARLLGYMKHPYARA